jgi:dienelactone hydrolase
MSPSSRRSFLTQSALAATLGGLAPAPSSTTLASADPPQDLEPSKADLGSLFPQVARLAETAAYPASYLSGNYPSLDACKAAGRELVWQALGYRPPKVPLAAEIVDREDCGDFIREKITFATSADLRVPAYVHVPKRLKNPAPAIVDLHSHGGMFLFGKEKVIDFGQNHPVMTRYHERNYGGRPTTTALVRRGYVVITIDALMFGERRLMLDEDLHYGWDRAKYTIEIADELNRKCRGKESTIAKSLTYAGMSWPGVITWDDVRTVDYLVTRPEVDPARIGCLGVSLGGWRTIFLAGLDERIAAACIVGFMSTVRPMLQRHIDTHSFAHFVPGLHRHLDLPDVAALMAPKPLLVLQCRQDGLFPLAGMEESVEKIAAIYGQAGVRDRFTGKFYEVPHRFDVPMQDDAFAWFDRHFKL